MWCASERSGWPTTLGFVHPQQGSHRRVGVLHQAGVVVHHQHGFGVTLEGALQQLLGPAQRALGCFAPRAFVRHRAPTLAQGKRRQQEQQRAANRQAPGPLPLLLQVALHRPLLGVGGFVAEPALAQYRQGSVGLQAINGTLQAQPQRVVAAHHSQRIGLQAQVAQRAHQTGHLTRSNQRVSVRAGQQGHVGEAELHRLQSRQRIGCADVGARDAREPLAQALAHGFVVQHGDARALQILQRLGWGFSSRQVDRKRRRSVALEKVRVRASLGGFHHGDHVHPSSLESLHRGGPGLQADGDLHPEFAPESLHQVDLETFGLTTGVERLEGCKGNIAAIAQGCLRLHHRTEPTPGQSQHAQPAPGPAGGPCVIYRPESSRVCGSQHAGFAGRVLRPPRTTPLLTVPQNPAEHVSREYQTTPLVGYLPHHQTELRSSFQRFSAKPAICL